MPESMLGDIGSLANVSAIKISTSYNGGAHPNGAHLSAVDREAPESTRGTLGYTKVAVVDSGASWRRIPGLLVKPGRFFAPVLDRAERR